MAAAAVSTVACTGAFVTMAPAAGASPIVGYACAYYSNVSLFGGPSSLRGCGQSIPPGDAESASPSVTLPSGGSSRVISSNDFDGAIATYGPAVIFGGQFQPDGSVSPSGQLLTSTTGTKTVVSSAQAHNVGPGPFTARLVFARCVASTSVNAYQVVLSNAVLVTSTDDQGNPVTTVNIPSTPPPGYSVPFTINSVGDVGIAVFNERVTNGDGSVTLNAVHIYLQGPTAVGDLVIGQVTCGH
jgi:hypothetical protein